MTALPVGLKGRIPVRAAQIMRCAQWLLFSACPVAAAGEDLPITDVVIIPAGPFVAGSDRAERDAAYALDEQAYGHAITRTQRWYETEADRARVDLPKFRITRHLITNGDYARFVAATGYPYPDVAPATWQSYGLIHPWQRTRRFAWSSARPPPARLEHPVVLVSQRDAEAYAHWLSQRTGKRWRLPTELEWEKAARGPDGNWFPWGDQFRPELLNSHDAGPFDTVPVGRFPLGASAYGLMDAAGQVFEWTSTVDSRGRVVVKGGSWDDKGCGVCRPAARHTRMADMKHILIGFRLVQE